MRDTDKDLTSIQRILAEEIRDRESVEAKLGEALVLLRRTLASREKYRRLVEDINAVIYATDAAGNVTYISPIIQSFTGLAPDDIIGHPFQEFILPPDRPVIREAYERVKVGDLRSTEYRLAHKSFGACWVRSFSRPVHDEGAFMGLRGVLVDISERKAAEQAVRETETKYQTIIESIEEGYFEVDLRGTLTFVNTPLSRILDCPRERLLQSSFRDYMTEGSAATLQRVFGRVHTTGEPVINHEFEALRNDRSLALELSASLLRDGENRPVGFRGIIRDVSERLRTEAERKELEKQLHHAQRMEAIGTLAGGIAHDFNNILMGMQGNISLLLMRLDGDDPVAEKLRTLEEYIQDGAGLTRQLLDFAKGGQRRSQAVNLTDLILKTAQMFGRTHKEIAIDTSGLRATRNVAVDRGQIEQVLLNLYLNAWQAMRGGGQLGLETEDLTIDAPMSQSIGIGPGHYVRVRVRDDGAGMEESILQKIFDPFFTTKERGRGTGLGLSSAYGIIKNHGGLIQVLSHPGAGSTFVLYLPATTLSAVIETRAPAAPVKGAGTILVVDDEEFIIEIAREWLTELGYQVLDARSGAEALELFRGRQDAIDLVLLDLVMPGMDGGETFDRLQAIKPAVRVLLTSGYSIDGRAGEIRKRGCQGFIQKPFTIGQLSEKIRGILAGNA
jgi:two-component system cell cycle sensor histidine kinase/response regulator CckA